MKIQPLVLSVLMLGVGACSSMYFGALEKIGVHKRDLMVDRVKAARDSQNETKQQLVSAMEQFRSVVNFKGGDLEKEYKKLAATLQKSEAKAADVHSRIEAIEEVSDALFREWRGEMKRYSSDSLRKASKQKYDATKSNYTELIAAMKQAESKLEPVLVPLRDQVLFLKHNLNAKAIAGLGDELMGVQTNVDNLVREMEGAIAKADAFITTLRTE